MKCLSCGSSVEKTENNACSYCGSVIRVDTFKSLLSTVGKLKDSFKFSSSEQTIDSLPQEEQNDAYHTHILVLIDKKLWSDVERISLKARDRFPTDSMFSIYILLSIITQGGIIFKNNEEINLLYTHINQDEDRVSQNLRGFFVEALNNLWAKKKKINTFEAITWNADEELKSLIKVIDPKIVSQIDTNNKLIDNSSDKKNKIFLKISEIVQDTNQKLEKDFYSKYENGIDSVTDNVNKKITSGDYKKNINEMISFYKDRENQYKKIIDDMNNDFSKQNIENKFYEFTKQNLLWNNKIPIGSFFGRFFLLLILSFGVSFYLNTELNAPHYIFWILLVISFILARFSISDRKNKKVMVFYERFLRQVPITLNKEIDSIKSSIRFL
jgi:hypothetical protein